jgi:hypothetical protein
MPALSASCHCGAVTVTVPRRPRSLTNCNCSLCRRYGALWAYYADRDVELHAAEGSTEDYRWGSQKLRFIRCRHCGCVMQWRPVQPGPASRTGVNARQFEPAALGAVRIRLLDGADTWKFLG